MSKPLDDFVSEALEELDKQDPALAATVMKGGSHAPSGMGGSLPGHAVEGLIARGGMGAVYRATQHALEREVAVKVMTSEADSVEMAERFRREALVLGRLEHPNIVPIHELGADEDGQLYYTMKLVKGRTLQAILNDLRSGDAETLHQHSLPSLLTVFRKVCDALAFAHSQGVLHRDLKPDNVMVGEFGEVLVMDWGLAKMMPGSQFSVLGSRLPELDAAGNREPRTENRELELATATLHGTVLGTPQYMSPEQAQGLVHELDERSDIFSLGGILYAILTLRPPVEGGTLEEVLAKVSAGAITSPTNLQANTAAKGKATAKGDVLEAKLIKPLPHVPTGRVPPALSSVVMKALRLDKARRYPTVAALSADIEAYQGGFATTAEQAGTWKQVKLLMLRHKAVSLSLAVMLLLSAGFVWKVMASERRAVKNEQIAIQEQESTRQALALAQIALAEAALREGNGPAMQAMLNAVPEELRDNTWHYLLDQADTSILTINSHEVVSQPSQDTSSRPSWAPYANAIDGVAAHPSRPGIFAMIRRDGTACLVNAWTGEIVPKFTTRIKVAEGYFCDGYEIAFAPDGQSMAVGCRNGRGIELHRTEDGGEIAAWDSEFAPRLEFSPDGRTLLQSTHIENKNLVLWDVTTRQQLWSTTQPSGRVIGAFSPDGTRVLAQDYQSKMAVLDATDGKVLGTLATPTPTDSMLWHPNGKAVIVGAGDGRILCFELETGRTLYQMRSTNASVSALAMCADGERFVSVSREADGRQVIQVREVNSGQLLRPVLGGMGATAGYVGSASVGDVCVHPKTGELITTGATVRAWSLGETGLGWNLDRNQRAPSLAFFGADDMVLGPAEDYGIGLVQLERDKVSTRWKAPKKEYFASAVSADGKVAVLGRPSTPDAFVVLRRTGDQVQEVATRKPQWSYTRFRLNTDGTRLAKMYSANRFLDIEELDKTGVCSIDREGIKTYHDVAWVGNQKLIALATYGSRRGEAGSEEWIVVSDALSGMRLRHIANPSAMDVLAVSPDGKRFAEGGADKHVRVRDAETLQVLQEFRAHDEGITAMAWHPAKAVLATGSTDHTIRLWNLETGRRMREFLGPSGAARTLAFSPSGNRLGCAAADGSTRIWELSSEHEAKGDRTPLPMPARAPATESIKDVAPPPASAPAAPLVKKEDTPLRLPPLAPPPASPASEGWQNLLASVDVKRDSLMAPWTLENGMLHSPKQAKMHESLLFRRPPPARDYDLRYRLRRNCFGFVLIIPFARGAECGTFTDGGGAEAGIRPLGSFVRSDRRWILEGGAVREVLIQVRKDRVRASIDSEMMSEFAGPLGRTSPTDAAFFPIKDAPGPVFGIGVCTGDITVVSAELRELDEQGKPVVAAQVPALPGTPRVPTPPQ